MKSKKPKIEDFEVKSHDCWGVTEYRINYRSYIEALIKYIEYLENKIK